MIQKYMPALICFSIVILFTSTTIGSSHSKHFNTYPNLPAPIADEKILITSTGQAAESSILLHIAESLNLEADYRPRALGTDLYDYNSVVIVLGYSANGLSHTNRSFQEELKRTDVLVKEANRTSLPIILVNISGTYRSNSRSWKLFEQIVPSADYYIALTDRINNNRSIQALSKISAPVTLINDLDELHIPFNSIFR